MEVIRNKLGGFLSKTKRLGNHAPGLGWAFQSPLGCEAILELFDTWPLRTKKHADYILWREAVKLWVVATRSNPPNLKRMEEINNELKDVKRYSPKARPKSTTRL
jgi:hypothetical protein